MKLKVDNQSTIALSKNPIFRERSEHIDTKYQFIRKCVKVGRVAIDHIRTEDQFADILTKFLGRAKFLLMSDMCQTYL